MSPFEKELRETMTLMTKEQIMEIIVRVFVTDREANARMVK